MTVPDPTAVRVALWRALHLEIDSPPHIVEDRIGLQLVAPDVGWRNRPDMHPQGTSGFRAGIVARARFVEDHLLERFNRGVRQFVILGRDWIPLPSEHLKACLGCVFLKWINRPRRNGNSND